MEKIIKVLKYKQDNNTATTINKKLKHIAGNIYYYTTDSTRDSEQTMFYNYYILCTNNIGYPLLEADYRTPEQITQILEKAKDFDTKYIINYLEQLKSNNKYINNLQLLFLEEIGEFDLLKDFREYKQKITQEINNKREQEEQERKARQEEQERKEQEQKAKKLTEAYQNIKNSKLITPLQFEMLCVDNNITLPPKFLGWLREFCSDIIIQKRDYEKIKKEYGYIPNFAYKYDTRYYYQKGHKSTMLAKYADKLAEAIGI